MQEFPELPFEFVVDDYRGTEEVPDRSVASKRMVTVSQNSGSVAGNF